MHSHKHNGRHAHTDILTHRYADHRGSYTNLLTHTCTLMHIKILTDIHNIHKEKVRHTKSTCLPLNLVKYPQKIVKVSDLWITLSYGMIHPMCKIARM